MGNWIDTLTHDPISPLVSSSNRAVVYASRRGLLGEDPGPVDDLWELPAALKILRRQQEDGSWKYSGGKPEIRSRANYNQLETYRMLGELVEKFTFTIKHPAIEKAADFLFGFQTEEGDFRGIYGRQYTPNYTGGIIELLIKAGYEDDPRVERGFEWLRSIRQDEGGWAIPLQTVGAKFDREVMHADTIKPDPTKPSSHMTTGCVLRAFAAHRLHRTTQETRVVGEYLASKFFKRHEYPGRQSVDFWTKFSYPFWFTDLLSSLDSLSLIGIPIENPHINLARQWFIERQGEDGMWKLKMLKGKDPDLRYWISFAICRVMKRLYDLG
jgi:hypothetical protein